MGEQATERIVVGAPPEQVFAVASDLEHYPDWTGDVKDVVIESRDSEGRPAVVTFRAAAFGRSTSYTLAYDYSDAPHTLAWRQTRGDLTNKLDGTYTFDAAGDGGTKVTYVLEVDLKVPLPGFVKRRTQSRIMHIALEELRDRVESTPAT